MHRIFPTRIREPGIAIGVSSQWLFNFVFSLTTPYMVKAMGSYVFLFYAALDFIMAILVWFFAKETKGRSLEEMETIFNSKAQFDNAAARQEGAAGGGFAGKFDHDGDGRAGSDAKSA